MEIDPINQARDVSVSIAPNKANETDATNLERKVDLSQEHTNGRMFEQAVQNANKTHETSAPPDVTRHADSKVDRETRAAIDRPLVLNDKQASEEQEAFYAPRAEEKPGAEEIMLEAFATRDMDPIKFSTLSLDLIALNGRKMDELMQARQESAVTNTAQDMSQDTAKDTAKEKVQDKPKNKQAKASDKPANEPQALSLVTKEKPAPKASILFDSKRNQLSKLAEATYQDVLRIEEELGKTFDDTLVKNLNAKAFGDEVVGILMG